MSAKQRPMARATPHTAPATYHYIATYTLWLVSANAVASLGQSRFSWGTI